MKQTYRKKPEYLDVVYVEDDSQSIRDIYELAGVTKAGIMFNDEGERVIELEGYRITPGMVVFKEQKSGKLVCMPKEKLEQFYDPFEGER